MEEKIEIENALGIARDVLSRVRRPITPVPFVPTDNNDEETPSSTTDRSLTLEAICRRGLELAGRHQ